MTDVIQLSDEALVQAINDEYSAILVSERNNLDRALAIGEKLVALKSRMEHGKWKPYLKEYCEISYRTGADYMRVYSKQAEWRAKCADPASLTIEGVLKLLRPDTPDNANKGNAGKSSKAVKGGVQEPAMDPTPASLPPDQALEGLANDEVFHTLQNVYENRQDELMELTTKLASHFGMMLMPLSQSRDLLEALGVPADAEASPV